MWPVDTTNEIRPTMAWRERILAQQNRFAIPLKEAKAMMMQGISFGMVSDYAFGEFPKYIWSVGGDGEVYEAKTDETTPGIYHGYRLEEEDDMRVHVKQVWKERCRPVGQ